METSILKRVSQGEIKGWVRGEVLDDPPPTLFYDPLSSVREMGGEVIKESIWRWAAIFCLSKGRRIFFRKDKTKGWAEHVKYLFSPTKGQKEFLIASRLERRNLNIPKPLGWLERVRRGWNFRLLDFEDIRMDERMNRKKLYKNFLQLNTSTPKVITKVDRFRFFREYLRYNPIVKDQRIFLGLWRESRRRGLVYVSSQGVVAETIG